MNIQGYVSAWRPSNINYAATQTENNNAKDSIFNNLPETDNYFDSTYWRNQMKGL